MDSGAPKHQRAYPPAASGYIFAVILMVAYAFAFVDRLAMGLVIDPIRHDMGLDDTQISLLVGFAFIACFVLFSLPFGRWIDTHPRRNAIAAGVGLWSLAMIVCGLASNFWQLFAGRLGLGIGEASLNPAAYSAIPDCFPPHRRSFAMAIFAAGAAIGGGIGIYLGSLLLQWAIATKPVLPIVGQIAPWKVMFILLGLPGLLMAGLVYCLIQEPERHQTGEFGTASMPIRDVARYLRAHWKIFLPTFVGFSGFAINNYGFTVWGPAYFMRIHHFSPSAVGLLFGFGFGVGGTIGMLLGGLWSDYELKRGRPEAPVWVGLRIAWIQLPFFVATYLCSNRAIACVLFVIGMTTASMVGGLQGTMIQALTPNRLRGQVGAVFLIIVNALGLGIAPTLTGAMTDHVFGGRLGIGKSLAVTSIVALGMTSIILISIMKRVHIQAKAVLES